MTRFGRRLVCIIALAVGASFTTFVMAAPPPNDDFDNATVITSLPFADTLDLSEATRAIDDPFWCSERETVWYRFTPASDIDVAINQFGSFSPMERTVWTGSRGVLDPVAADCSRGVAEFTAFAGTTYFIMVNPSQFSGTGVLSLHVAEAQNRYARHVIGQPGEFSAGCNSFYGLSASSLCQPSEVLVASEVLYVADRGNHRILAYDDPLTTDTVADFVFGQMGGFTSGTCNFGGLGANSICQPNGLAVDGSGNLFVSDFNNNRVLEFDTPLTTDTQADRVFGQPDFTTATCNTGGLSASSLCQPRGLAMDATGNLYVSDGFVTNHRVLVYENPLINTVADEVFGQPDFTTAGCNTGGISAGSVCTPSGTAFDAAGNLYLADQGNNRVLIYFNPLLNDGLADMVIGQPGFDTALFPPPSESTLNQPIDLALDSLGNLYVTDALNHRVLVYRSPLSTDAVADLVYGQPDFTNGMANWEYGATLRTLSTPRGIGLDADNNLYVADLGNSRVLVFDTDADWDGMFGSFDGCPQQAPAQGLDADHNGCTDTIAGLKFIVQNLSINSTLKNGLIGKLDEAQKALNRGNTQVATNKLLSFIDQVKAAKKNHQITDVDADLLIAYANNLLALLGGRTLL